MMMKSTRFSRGNSLCVMLAAALVVGPVTAFGEERPLQTFVQKILGIQPERPARVQQVQVEVITDDVAEEAPLVVPFTPGRSTIDAKAEDGEENEDLLPTHAESGVITIKNANGCRLNSFCVSPEGKILAACSHSNGKTGELQVFNADGKEIGVWKLPMLPQAVNFGPNGELFVAGEGKLARLNAEGRIEAEWETPNAAEVRKNAEAIMERTIASRRAMTKRYAEMADRFEQQAKELEEKDDATAADKSRARTLRSQIAIYRRLGDSSEKALKTQAEAALKSKMKVSALAVSDKHVFIACTATEGYGFEVYRADHKMGDTKKIITGLRGCCGQMDIQCCQGEVYVAENSRHRVCRYSHEGELLGTFGKRARTGSEGFGSCCNPMNLRFDANGELYTSESSVGRIKKYSRDGKLLSVVGKAKIVPGCKNVSIGLSPKGDKVYMMDITRSRIVIMSGPTPDAKNDAVSQVNGK